MFSRVSAPANVGEPVEGDAPNAAEMISFKGINPRTRRSIASVSVNEASESARRHSLPLILARELAANLSTPMFLLDGEGTLVFYNDAAELLLGRPFAELGEMSAYEFGDRLELRHADGSPMPRREAPSGIAFYERRPVHRVVVATAFDGTPRIVEATSYPLFGFGDELHGVVTVFWPRPEEPDEA